MSIEYTEFQRAVRVTDVMEIKNLLGRRMFLRSYGMTAEEFEKLWVTAGDTAVYTQNDLCIHGLENIRRAFEQKDARCGDGYTEMQTLTTPLIEVAGDGKTAQGFWYSLGQHCNAGEKGRWAHARYCADFVKEPKGWRIWHLFIGSDSNIEAGTSREDQPSLPLEPALCELSEADCAAIEHERGVFYDPSFNWSHFPALPVEYDSFGHGVRNTPEA